MRRLLVTSLAVATLFLAGPLPTLRANIAWTGNVDPADPLTWTSTTTAYIGQTATGTLIVNNGTISSSAAYLGYNSGISGSATISGANSQWINSSCLYVGNGGSGTLNVTGGGSVSNYYGCCIGENSSATGVVTVDGAGSKWTIRNNLQISSYGSGTLNVTNGASVSNAYGYIAAYSNSTGTVTVDGASSTWTCNGDIEVGSSGSGTLNVTNGSAVIVSGTTYVAYSPGATGAINFGASGGTLTTASLVASPSQLTGTGTVNARALVSDVDLVFGSTASLTQTLTFNSLPNQNIRLNLNMASSQSTNGVLGAGYQGSGSLMIQNGITVNSSSGCLGYKSCSVGVVTVDGPNSTWIIGGGPYDTGRLHVGFYGSGTLNVTNGGSVSNRYGYIGFYGSGLTSVVTVDGAASTWTNSRDLYVGYSSSGTLNVTDGGAVTVGGTTYVAADSYATGAISFGPNGGTLTTTTLIASPSQLTGTGTVNANGLISDFDLVFDSTASLTQKLVFNRLPNQDITLNLNMTESPGTLGIGYRGNASLTIRNGTTVNSYTGYLGYKPGSKGVALVEGAQLDVAHQRAFRRFYGQRRA